MGDLGNTTFKYAITSREIGPQLDKSTGIAIFHLGGSGRKIGTDGRG